jgi:hypothetical protein
MAAQDIDQGLRLDKNATKIALGYYEGLEDRAVMDVLAPQIKVPANGKYPSYGRGAWYDDDEDEIGPGATQVNEYIPPAESWNAYVINMKARKVTIADAEANLSGIVKGMIYSDRKTAAKRLTDVLYQKYCSRVADIYTAISNSAAPGTAWDEAGATPFDDLQTWTIALKNLIGVGGYTAFTTDRVIMHLGEGCRAKYSHTGNMTNFDIVSKNVVRDLGWKRLIVSGNAEKYGTSAFSSIWGNNFYLFKNQDQMNGWQPTFCATLVPNDKQFLQVMKPYGREVLDLLGDYVQVRMWYLQKSLDSNAAYMGSSVIS